MTTSENGYALIRKEEGLTLTVKGDTGGKQVIGYGHDLLPGESYPNGIDEATAEFLLEHDVAKCEAVLNPLIPADCTQNQFDALIDFEYETGNVKMLLSHGWDQVPAQLPRWVYAHVNGVLTKLPGMVLRRAVEAGLFSTPDAEAA